HSKASKGDSLDTCQTISRTKAPKTEAASACWSRTKSSIGPTNSMYQRSGFPSGGGAAWHRRPRPDKHLGTRLPDQTGHLGREFPASPRLDQKLSTERRWALR